MSTTAPDIPGLIRLTAPGFESATDTARSRMLASNCLHLADQCAQHLVNFACPNAPLARVDDTRSVPLWMWESTPLRRRSDGTSYRLHVRFRAYVGVEAQTWQIFFRVGSSPRAAGSQPRGVPETAWWDIPSSGTPAWYEGVVHLELDPLGTSIPTLDEPSGDPIALVTDLVYFDLRARRTSGAGSSPSVIAVDHLTVREYVGP